MTFLPQALYEQVEAAVPMICVDFATFRQRETLEVGLIERESPFGIVWCHLGGRILRGETVGQALQRHAFDTLGVDLQLPLDPQPDYVFQWFPPDIAPVGPMLFGSDPRKHAVALTFAVELHGEPIPRNEARSFDYFAVDDLPKALWPGTEHLVRTLVAARQRT